MSIEAINVKIDQARIVYLWIKNSNIAGEGKYVETPKAWMKQLIANEFSGQVDYTLDEKTNEIYFH